MGPHRLARRIALIAALALAAGGGAMAGDAEAQAPSWTPREPEREDPADELWPDRHGFVLGLEGSYRLVPRTRTEALGFGGGYHFSHGRIDHAFTLMLGVGFGSGNCGGENVLGGHLAYSVLLRSHWLVTGGELAVGGYTEKRCQRDPDGAIIGERSVDRISLAWLVGARVNRVLFGVSLRGGLGEWSRFRGGAGPVEDAGGFTPTVDLGTWIQLRL